MLMRALPSTKAGVAQYRCYVATAETVAKKKLGVFFQNLYNEKRPLKQYCEMAVQVRHLLNQNTAEMFQTLVIPKNQSLTNKSTCCLVLIYLFIRLCIMKIFKAHVSASCTMFEKEKKRIFLRIVYLFLPCRNV